MCVGELSRHPRENASVVGGVAVAPVALARAVARAHLPVVRREAAALALVAAAVVPRPTLVAPGRARFIREHPDMMSASKGGWLWKSRRSKGDCVNFLAQISSKYG